MNGEPIRILVIEDEHLSRAVIGDLLTDEGLKRFGLQFVGTVKEAGAVIQQEDIDLILLDLNLPDSRGLETFERVKSLTPELPIVIYSATGDEDIAVSAMKRGAQDYLIKGKIDGNILVRSFLYAIERKRVEEALRKSEERYRALVENATEGILVARDGVIMFANAFILKTSGYSEGEIIGKPFIEFIHPDDREIVLGRHLKRLGGEDALGVYTYRIIEKSGRIIRVETNSILVDWEGKTSVLSFLIDITKRHEAEEALMKAQLELEHTVTKRTRELLKANKSLEQKIGEQRRAEEEIRESEQRWRNLFESSRDGIFFSSIEGRVIDLNRAARELFGYTEEDTSGLFVEDFYCDMDDRKIFQERIAKDGYVKDYEVKLKRKDGTFIECLATATPITDQARNIRGFQGTIREVTDMRKFVDMTLNSVADGVMIIDNNLKITYFYAAAERITGMSRKEVIGKSVDEVFRISTEGKLSSMRDFFTAEDKIQGLEAEITNRKGVQVSVSIGTTVLRNRDGVVIGGVVTIRDQSLLRELKTSAYVFEGIISKNKKMRELFDTLPHISESESTVLVEGKSGTGKELVARAIHNRSFRRAGPFIAVNCAALPENLLESELFGYVKGAFTNALIDKPGRFALAEGGTIFLDEIAEIPKSLQVKLLRVIEERIYEPLGSVRSTKADVRIVASSNRDIAQEVELGNFREDLFYRLNVVRIHLPDLRERREDIPLLVQHFIEKMAGRMNTEPLSMSRKVMDFLMRYDYPGNIRQLENIIEHSFVLCRGDTITMKNLPEDLHANSNEIVHEEKRPLRSATIDVERKIIEDALSHHHGNRKTTAHSLRMDRTTLWRKMKKYNLLDEA